MPPEFDAWFGPRRRGPADWRAMPDSAPDDDALLVVTPRDVVGVLGFDPLELAASALSKAAPRTLFVKRTLLNADAVRAWAAEQGIASTLAPGDMHVTVAFSREPVDWSAVSPEEHQVAVTARERSVVQFPPRDTPNGALVLRFASGSLEDRWAELRDAGASWDFPEYLPHVTLTYSVAEADVGAIDPYAGPLVFGPEEWAEVDEGWGAGVVEVPTKKSVPRVRSRRV